MARAACGRAGHHGRERDRRHHRQGAGAMMAAALTRNAAEFSFDPADIAQIELYILRWMREFTSGDHASLSTGTGFNLVGLKDWEPGDAISTVDWAQSSLTNFSP